MILIVNLVLLGVSLFWFITAVTTMPLWQGISLAGGSCLRSYDSVAIL